MAAHRRGLKPPGGKGWPRRVECSRQVGDGLGKSTGAADGNGQAQPDSDLKIVVIGGGSGTSAVLQGLKRYTEQVSAIVTMFDSGGSSGLLQEEFGYPPLGDLRQCLLGLSDGDEAARAPAGVGGFPVQPGEQSQRPQLGQPAAGRPDHAGQGLGAGR